jgi:hypothetical protein
MATGSVSPLRPDHQACTSRAFVVHLRVDADPTLGSFRGRVQHLRTGDAAHFDSLEELAAFLADHVGGDAAVIL